VKLIDKFIVFEQENNLFHEEVRDFKYWHYIRFEIYNQILNQKENIGQAHTSLAGVSFIQRFWLKLKQINHFITKNPLWFLKKRDILVLNHHRRVKNEEYFDCIYTDELIKNIQHSYYVFEQPILEKHMKPIRTKNIKYMDYIGFKIAVRFVIISKLLKFRLSKDEEKEIKRVAEKLSNSLDVKLDSVDIIQTVTRRFLSYKLYKKQYRKILDKVKPQVIIQVVSYVTDKIIINELAKERGIPVIELQHGTMGKYHVAYNFAEKFDLPTFPDYIFSFGQFWKDNTRFPIDNSRVKVVGWPFYEKKVSEYRKENKKNEKRVILFISQGTIGKELSQIALDLSEQVDLEKNKIIYKLHPGEYARWKDEYPWLIDSKIEVVDKNEFDMHYYFSQADVQIGVYSTAIYEGLGYNLDTYVCKFYGHEFMKELYNVGLAVLVQSSKELIVKLEENRSDKDMDASYFWETNSMSNIKNEIKSLIQNDQHSK
jgi:hypothetical protein